MCIIKPLDVKTTANNSLLFINADESVEHHMKNWWKINYK